MSNYWLLHAIPVIQGTTGDVLNIQGTKQVLPQKVSDLNLVVISQIHKFTSNHCFSANRNDDKCKCWVGFSVEMAHKITAGCDMLLMPSRFEPCGLNQLYAMAYGTVPVVRAESSPK